MRLLPWALPVALLWRRRNRSLRAASVFLLAFAIQAAGFVVAMRLEAAFGDLHASFPLDLAGALLAGLAGIWLLTDKSRPGGWSNVLPRSIAVLGATAIMGAIGTSCGGLSSEIVFFLFASGLLILSLLLGVGVGIYRQKRTSSLRSLLVSMFWAALLLPSLAGIAAGVGFGILLAIFSGQVEVVFGLPLIAGLAGLGTGIVNGALLLIFFVFTRYSGEYRERWLTEISPPAPSSTAAIPPIPTANEVPMTTPAESANDGGPPPIELQRHEEEDSEANNRTRPGVGSKED